jgi:predicted CoA-binding protein
MMEGSGGNLTTASDEWRTRLVEDAAGITAILASMRRIAVIGIKPAEAGGPAATVPAFLQREGFDVVPVPVYYPEASEILGVPVHRTLQTVDPPADLVQLFRRPSDVPRHVDDILAASPRVVWMQSGIRHEAAAEAFARAGILVVQDRCLQVERERRGRTRSAASGSTAAG